MRISAVIENTSQCGLQTEHGLSLWIEACGRRFYFDLGQGEMFVHNSRSMGFEPSDAEFAIVSHGHYDHGGGIEAFLDVNPYAPIYINRHAFIDCYAWRGDSARYIGLSKSVRPGGRIVTTEGVTQLSDGLILIDGCYGEEFFSPANKRILKRHEPGLETGFTSYPSKKTLPIDDHTLIYLKDENDSTELTLIEDDFRHEQSLIIVEEERRVLIGGCAHSGIINMMDKAEKVMGQPLTDVITGLHLKGVEDMEFIDSLSDALLRRNCNYYTCHCTGDVAYQRLKERMGDSIDYLSAGQTIVI